jgi:hypothetical protein
LAYSLARESEKHAPEGPTASPPAEPVDPDLTRIMTAWLSLPEPIRAAMLAMVASVSPARMAP